MSESTYTEVAHSGEWAEGVEGPIARGYIGEENINKGG